MNIENVLSNLEKIWYPEPELTSMKFDVDSVSDLSDEILDDYLLIHEVIPADKLQEASNNFGELLRDSFVIPFLVTLGDNVICLGYGIDNKGEIYYYDMDFGLFKIAESLDCFLEALVAKDEDDLFVS